MELFAYVQSLKFLEDHLRSVYPPAEATLQQDLSSPSGDLRQDLCHYRHEKIHETEDSRGSEDHAVIIRSRPGKDVDQFDHVGRVVRGAVIAHRQSLLN